jgi:DNA repair exonuclease SbcCD ATPase subunit
MYSIVNHCLGKSEQPAETKDVVRGNQSETVLIEKVFYPGLDANFPKKQDFFTEEISGQLEQPLNEDFKPKWAEFVCRENNLIQLEDDINQLKISLKQAKLSHQQALEKKLNQGIDNLQAQAELINELAAQLEAEITKFKEQAREVNQDYHAWQNNQHQSKDSYSQLERRRPANIWEIRSSLIPRVVKQGNQFILTTKPVAEVAEDNPENRVKKAQQRQKALESWLEAKRKRIMEDFSSP